jgi:hypothetical protein
MRRLLATHRCPQKSMFFSEEKNQKTVNPSTAPKIEAMSGILPPAQK